MMDSKSKSIVSGLSMSVNNDVTEYVGEATLRIELPGSSGSDTTSHHINIDIIHSEGHNNGINLKNLPEIDLGGSCMVIPLTTKDVEFTVQADTKNYHEMNIKALVRRAIEPRVIVVDSDSVRNNVTQHTDVRTWCTVPFKYIPIGTTLEILLSPEVKDKATVDYIVDFIQAHYANNVAGIKQEVDTIINQTQELTISPIVEGDLLDNDDAADGSNYSLDSLKANLSPAFPPNEFQTQSPSAISPTLDATVTPPTNLSMDLTQEDLEFLESIGTVKTIKQRNLAATNIAIRGSYEISRRQGLRGRGYYGKQRTVTRGGYSNRGSYRNHSFRNRPTGRGEHQEFRGGHARNANVYNQSILGVNLPVNMDIERQQGRVSKDPFWAEKAAKSRWRLTDQPGFGYMPTTTTTTAERTPISRAPKFPRERAVRHHRFDMHGNNLQQQAGTTAWNEFATDETKSSPVGRPSVVVEELIASKVLRTEPVRKLRRGGALFGAI